MHAEEEQARFFDRVLPALYQAGVPMLCHAAWADLPPGQQQQPPFDRNLFLRHSGILRASGTEKEAATIWRSFHRNLAGQEEPQPAGRPLDLDPDEWYQRRGEAGYVAGLYQMFLNGEV
jgi:hypothetical protein